MNISYSYTTKYLINKLYFGKIKHFVQDLASSSMGNFTQAYLFPESKYFALYFVLERIVYIIFQLFSNFYLFSFRILCFCANIIYKWCIHTIQILSTLGWAYFIWNFLQPVLCCFDFFCYWSSNFSIFFYAAIFSSNNMDKIYWSIWQ